MASISSFTLGRRLGSVGKVMSRMLSSGRLIVNHFACSLGRRSHAFQVVMVDGVGDLVEFALQAGPIRKTVRRRKEHIQRGIEFAPGSRDITQLIEPLARFQMLVRARHPAVHLLPAGRLRLRPAGLSRESHWHKGWCANCRRCFKAWFDGDRSGRQEGKFEGLLLLVAQPLVSSASEHSNCGDERRGAVT